MQTTDRKLIAKADKTKLSAAERLLIEKHCRPLSCMLQVKPDARAAFKSNAAWSAVRLKLKHLLQKATPESPCALTLIELLLVDGVDSVDGWGEFEDPLREDLQIIFDIAPPARDADAKRVLALAEEIEDDLKELWEPALRKLKLQLAAMAIVIGMRPLDETDGKAVLIAGEFKPATGLYWDYQGRARLVQLHGLILPCASRLVKKKQRAVKRRKFKPCWNSVLPDLRFEGGSMWCEVCRSMQIDNKMADGYNIETDNQRFTVQVVTEHSSTFGKNSHASALRKRAYLLSITQHSLVVKDATKLGFFRLIRIVISRTIHDESIAQFPSECELQRRNGVTLPNQYCNEKGFKEILYSARNVARKKKNNRCNKYRVITYGTDGGEMAGQHVQTGTLAGMDYDSGKVEVDFEGLWQPKSFNDVALLLGESDNVEAMTAREYDKALRVSQESEAETVSKRFKDSNRNILKLCLSMVDGALMGEKSGYTGAMQRLIPHHMSVWDGAHRLSLVTNGAYKQSGITEILKHDKWEASVAKYYRKSPKARTGLHAFQRLYGLPILKAEKPNPGRWFARYKASKKHLQLLKPSTAHCLKASGASAKTLAKYQLSAPCQMLSHMKTDLLEPMASISSQLQFKTGRVADHTPAIEATREFIQKRFVETSYIIGSSQTAEY